MNDIRYVVITPVRNEEKFIGLTIASITAQTCLPYRWIVVNDGSTDGTGHILEQAAQLYPWLTVIHRPDRGFRKSGGGVVEAFYDGYATLGDEAWDYLVKLDADLSFEPDYFERCFRHFASDVRLGIAGGTVCILDGGRRVVDSPGDPAFHVRGATKIYRRACWEAIKPLVAGPGWDTVDEVRANMLGWRTLTFGDASLLQHRATGSVDGAWGNWFKNGLANYITGYHPLFMIGKCIKRLSQKPRLLAGTALWAGFCSGYLRRQPHIADGESVQYLRRQQLQRMLLRPSIYDRVGRKD